MSEVIFLGNVRLSFPKIAEPQVTVNKVTGEKRVSYNAVFLMQPDDPQFQQIMKRFTELATNHANEHASAVMQMIQNDRKSRCFFRGEEAVNKLTYQPWDGYAGMVAVTAGSKTMPQIIQPDGNPVDPANTMACMQLARRFYGGCRVNVALKPWWQKPNAEKQYGHGFRCDLVAIQFASDDTAFGDSPPDVKGMFGQVAPQAGPSAAGMQAPAMPGFMGGSAPAPAAPAMPAPPFGAPAPVGLPSFFGR